MAAQRSFREASGERCRQLGLAQAWGMKVRHESITCIYLSSGKVKVAVHKYLFTAPATLSVRLPRPGRWPPDRFCYFSRYL